MALDYNQPIDIKIESCKFNVNELPEKIRSTHRFLLKFISIANYSVDQDCVITLFFTQLNDDSERQVSYNLLAADNRFKQKLPVGVTAREFRIQIVGEGLTTAEISEIEVLWTPILIGDR